MNEALRYYTDGCRSLFNDYEGTSFVGYIDEITEAAEIVPASQCKTKNHAISVDTDGCINYGCGCASHPERVANGTRYMGFYECCWFDGCAWDEMKAEGREKEHFLWKEDPE